MDILNQWWAFTRLSRNQTEEMKVWLAGAAAVLVLLFWAWNRWLKPRQDKLAKGSRIGLLALLGGLTLMSVENYARHDWTYVYGLGDVKAGRVDAYDLTHYYLNARYYDQLGYFELYPAVLLADLEEGGPHFRMPPTVQFQTEEQGYYFVEYGAFARDKAEHERIRALFDSPEQWEQFKHDFVYLQRNVVGFTQSTWEQMVWDHGFNGAPTWVMIAKPMAQAVPVEWVKLLGYTDLAWLLVAVGFVAWAYGFEAAAWLLLFLMTTYSMRWPTLTWAFGRYDYVSLLIIATALLKKLKHGWAGAATALSTAFRVFPAVWLFGPAVKGAIELGEWAWDKARKVSSPRPFPMPLLKLGGLFFAVHLALWGGVVATFGSAQPIEKHFENLFEHTTEENLSSMRQGFAIGAAFLPEEMGQSLTYVTQGRPKPSFNNRMNAGRRTRIAMQKSWRQPVAILLVLLLGLGLRRKDDDEAFAFGVVPFFLMATASYYYYVIRGTLVAMHAGDLSKGRNAVGLAGLFALESAINWVQQNHSHWRVVHIGWMAWGLMLYTGVMILWLNWESLQVDIARFRARKAPEGGEGTEADTTAAPTA
ncbi:MAG: hypothetical protein VX899_18755 [Myxococcota bacterium]|nr:hypothetical protein [Myxococcota bacterium]